MWKKLAMIQRGSRLQKSVWQPGKKSAVFQEIILVEQKREGEEGGERLPNSSCLLKVPTFVRPHKK